MFNYFFYQVVNKLITVMTQSIVDLISEYFGLIKYTLNKLGVV